ncbi:hypothetical protein [Streptomyces sp. NPDC051572]|uniref:hypothetical protein n=1 Tax=Streptomyces sp. NPDC051572 TaxID=3155802 RepID=UPI00344D0BEC
MPIARHARRRTKRPLSADPLWSDITQQVQYASELALAYEGRGLSRQIAGWVAEGHIRAAIGHLQQISERHASRARTALGRAWRRRQMRAAQHELEDGLWFTQRMQQRNDAELFWPPTVFSRTPVSVTGPAPVPVPGPPSPRFYWASAA